MLSMSRTTAAALRLVVSAAIVAAAAGCAAPQPSAPVYDARTAGAASTTRPVTILAVRNVLIRKEASRTQQILGGGAGAAIGGVIGNAIGKGNGRTLAQVLGVTAGAAVGSSAVDAGQLVPGYELTVRTTDRMAETLVITQAAEQVAFAPGQSALLTSGAGGQRVVP